MKWTGPSKKAGDPLPYSIEQSAYFFDLMKNFEVKEIEKAVRFINFGHHDDVYR